MKKMVSMILVLFIIYLGIQFAFNFFSNGDEINYNLNINDKKFIINEKSDFKSNNNYRFSVNFEDINYEFQIFKDYKKNKKILKDIKYYKDDNLKCILPIFKDNLILMDMICYNNNEFTYYYNLKGQNKDLDEFIKNIDIYDINQFKDKSKNENIEGLKVYRDNLVDNHYLSLTNYKGLYVISENINSTIYNISLFDKDVYNQELGIYYKNYYVVADYNDKHDFHDFKVVDLINLNITKIKTDFDISFDSEIFIKDDCIYLKDNENQNIYEIDIKNKKVFLSNKQTNNISTFDERIDEQKINNSGYKYLYKKDGNQFKVYRKDINSDSEIFLFKTNSIDKVIYIDDFVYFVDNNIIKIYNDNIGVRKLIEYSELEYNKNINLYVYK